jgi:hypothetical protein
MDWESPEKEFSGDEDIDVDATTAEEIFFIAGLESMEEVLALLEDGSCGPYGQIPKSKDWFKACLMSPDQDFQRTFRFVL